MKGFVNIIKPSGITSAAAVAKVRHALHTDCGHMGTLDPMAEGVLPIALGKTCRLFDYLLDKEKVYEAVFVFGYETDTLDKTGETLSTSNVIPTLEEIKSILPKFVGDIMQVPPKYSAKNINGVKGYKLARRGVQFELQAKQVTILSIDILGYENSALCLRIKCKGGTYIRSLCRDIASELNTVATMEKLVRTQCGVFKIENGIDAKVFEKIENPESYVLPSDYPLTFEKITLDDENARRLKDGLPRWCKKKEGLYAVYGLGEFICVGEVKDGLLKVKSYVAN